MSPADIIRNAQSTNLVDEDGDAISLTLLPPLSDTELDGFAATLPCPLPTEIVELLRYCRGFEGDEVIFPHGIPIATDGFGNFWVVDLTPESTEFGPVYFACHDAPVVLYQ